MNKKLLLILLLFILSGCSTLLGFGSNYKANTTNNGSIIMNNGDLNYLCNKASVETYLSNAKLDSIKEEFNISDYDKLKYEANKDHYKKVDTGDSCQYTIYHFNYVDEANSAYLTSLKLDKDSKVDFVSLYQNGIIDNYIKNDKFSISDIFLKNKLINITLNDLENINLQAKDSAEYNIMMYPVFRFNYLKDNNKIYDYEFSSLGGISFKLVKK